MTTATFTLPARRFAWKEYRTLRSLWLSVAALAIIVQAISALFAAPGTDLPAWLFGSALAAAALYAVGAAAIQFAVEHEDETYNFLTGLPVTWLPLFAGKLLVATASALALAATLVLTGWAIAGGHFPSPNIAGQIASLFGVAILEALAWGTFFSLLLAQPLLAALLTIVTLSVSIHATVTLMQQSVTPSTDLASYLPTNPLRLLIAAAVFAVDLRLACRWLNRSSSRFTSTTSSVATPGQTLAATPFSQIRAPLALPIVSALNHAFHFRLAVLARLIWQTWRQSWTLMLAMFAIVLGLTSIAVLFLCLLGHALFWRWNAELFVIPEVVLGMSIVATALYASAIFAPDQRRERFRFLAEHAAWPRYVWISRLAVWSLPLAALALVAALCIAKFAVPELDWWVQRAIGSITVPDRYETLHALVLWSGNYRMLVDSVFAAVLGLFTGFAIGQFSSLTASRALLAGLLAVVLAFIIAVWSAAISLWELPWRWFILPIPLAFLVASWLRASDWIISRTQPSAWLKVAAVIALPLFAMIVSVPGARLHQVAIPPKMAESVRDALHLPDAINTPAALDDSVKSLISDRLQEFATINTPEARANGDKLLRVAEMIVYVEKPWIEKQHEAELASRRDDDPTPGDLHEWQRGRVEANREVIEQAIPLSSRSPCRLPLIERRYWDFWVHNVKRLCELLVDAGDVATENGRLDDALENYCAALRIDGNFRRGQNTSVFASDFAEREAYDHIVNWAASSGQSTDRIRHAIAELGIIYPENSTSSQQVPTPNRYTPPRFQDSLTADYVRLHEMLLEKQTPTNFYEWSSPDFVAYIANKLPFERERALRVLDYLVASNDGQWTQLENLLLKQQQLHDSDGADDEDTRARLAAISATDLRRMLRYYCELDGNRHYPYQIPNWAPPPFSWLRTTYMLRLEYQDQYMVGEAMARAIDSKVIIRGLKLQLALIAYRLDHGQYPVKFAALVPNYLPSVPLDPYSGAPFQYEPRGLPGPLRGSMISTASEPLPSDTPFSWSVGRFDGSLAKLPCQITETSYADDVKSGIEPSEFQYRFTSNEFSSRGESANLVFPLPK